LLCKKISNVGEANCYCLTYSKCWTPINAEVSGVCFSNTLEFKYHFDHDDLSNLIL